MPSSVAPNTGAATHSLVALEWVPISRAGRLADGRLTQAVVSRAVAAEHTARHASTVVHGYVDPTRLTKLAADGGRSVPETFAEYLPTAPALKSGDFGEMLVFAALQSRDTPLTFPLYRWRTRITRNSTVMGVDLVGYLVFNPAAPSPEDLLVFCEVKTRSGRAKKLIVENAYRGVTRDYVTRLNSQLLFQQTLLLQMGREQEANQLARFRNPHRHGAFRKRLVAAVVHNHATWRDEFLDCLPAKHGLGADVDCEVALVTVESLATWIEEVRTAAITASELCAAACEDRGLPPGKPLSATLIAP